jgi:hypothetical protein
MPAIASAASTAEHASKSRPSDIFLVPLSPQFGRGGSYHATNL